MFKVKESFNFDNLISKASREKAESNMRLFKNFFKDNNIQEEDNELSAANAYEIIKEMTNTFMRQVSIYNRYKLLKKFAIFMGVLTSLSLFFLGLQFVFVVCLGMIAYGAVGVFNYYYSIGKQEKNLEGFQTYLKNYPAVFEDSKLYIDKMFYSVLSCDDYEMNKKIKMEIKNQVGGKILEIKNSKNWEMENWVESFDSLNKKFSLMRKLKLEEKKEISDSFDFNLG